jgi:alpha-1,2-mannosyltransferase
MTSAGGGGRRGLSTWAVSYREARVHALVVAAVLWSGAALVTFGSAGDRNLADHVKGEDFLQIYTLAHVAFEGNYPMPTRQEQFYQRQVALVPASTGDHYFPVYPPSAAVIFRPLAALPYRSALTVWTLITIAGYAYAIRSAWLPVRSALPDGWFVARAAAAFPPFFLLVLYGQTTLIPLLAFLFGWRALDAGRPFLAGAAIGLLAVKPQFALVIGPALLVGRNWAILCGLLISGGIQFLVIWLALGTQAISAYAQTISTLPQIEHLLEPDGWRMHSIRTLTRLVPDPGGDLLWLAASTWVVVAAIRVWRGPAPLSVRFAVVVLATVLVNPHLFGYDALVLALPILWLGGWVETARSRCRTEFWQGVYLLSVLILFPTALVMPLQLSVILMLWMFWRVVNALPVRTRAEFSVAQ